MQTHVKVLGVLHIVFGALGVLVALGIMAIFGSMAGLIGVSADHDAVVAAPIVGVIGTLIMVLILDSLHTWDHHRLGHYELQDLGADLGHRAVRLRVDSRAVRNHSRHLRIVGAAVA